MGFTDLDLNIKCRRYSKKQQSLFKRFGVESDIFKAFSIVFNLFGPKALVGLPRWLSDIEPACQCRRHKIHGFSLWVGMMPWRRAWQSTPVFSPRESHGQRSLGATVHRVTKSQTGLKQLTTHTRHWLFKR